MFPWLILQLWSQARASSVLLGPETPAELLSDLYFWAVSRQTVQSQLYNGHEHAQMQPHVHSSKICMFVKQSRTCKQTEAMQSPPSSDTQIHKFSRIPLVMYSLWCVRLCSLSLKALKAAPECVRVAALVYVLRRRAYMSGSSGVHTLSGPFLKYFTKFARRMNNKAEFESHVFDGSILLQHQNLIQWVRGFGMCAFISTRLCIRMFLYSTIVLTSYCFHSAVVRMTWAHLKSDKMEMIIRAVSGGFHHRSKCLITL